MPPSTRRRVQQTELRSPNLDDDTDSEIELHLGNRSLQQRLQDPTENLEGELIEVEEDEEEEEDLEDEEALASPGGQQNPLPNLDPPPSYLREISTLASWTVSSSKPGCSIPQLRHPSTSMFWQSDGPQPHYLNIHFFKLVRIVGLRLYLDFEQDESYTPTRIMFLAGSGMNDLQEWGEMRLESPRGWVWADFSGVDDPESDSETSDAENDNDGDEAQDQQMLNDVPSAAGRETSSDSENNNPRQRAMHRFLAENASADDTIAIDPSPSGPSAQFPRGDQAPIFTPQTAHAHPFATPPTFPPQQQNTPNPASLTRPTPRQPFAHLSPNPILPRPNSRQRRPKLPVLRAHLVQIKILENHQNGKDTHLRGLQIFARNDEGEGRKTGVVTKVKMEKAGRGKEYGKTGLAKREKKIERLELGGYEDNIR